MSPLNFNVLTLDEASSGIPHLEARTPSEVLQDAVPPPGKPRSRCSKPHCSTDYLGSQPPVLVRIACDACLCFLLGNVVCITQSLKLHLCLARGEASYAAYDLSQPPIHLRRVEQRSFALQDSPIYITLDFEEGRRQDIGHW